MLVIFPMLRLVSLGNFRQRRLTHEHIGVDDDEEEGETTQTNLQMRTNENLRYGKPLRDGYLLLQPDLFFLLLPTPFP